MTLTDSIPLPLYGRWRMRPAKLTNCFTDPSAKAVWCEIFVGPKGRVDGIRIGRLSRGARVSMAAEGN